MNNSIYPCITVDNNAHAVGDFYVRIFPNSSIVNKTPFVSILNLNGNRFMVLNGGPEFRPSNGISFVVSCENQEEIDYYWNHLTKDGEEGKCGWLVDKFGIHWQIVPKILSQLMNDTEKAPKAMYAFMQMKKIIIQDLM